MPGTFVYHTPTSIYGMADTDEQPCSIEYACPGCGCSLICFFDNHIHEFYDSPSKRGEWHWDGNIESPTITTSAFGADDDFQGPCPSCDWTGYIIKGRFATLSGAEPERIADVLEYRARSRAANA